MNNVECPFEREIVHSILSGQLNERAQQHLATCASCSELLFVTQALRSAREETLAHVPALPVHTAIWLRAQFEKRQERLSKVDLIKLLGLSFLGALACMAFVFIVIPSLPSLILNSVSGYLPHWQTMLPLSIPVAFIIAVMAAIWIFSLEFFFARR